MKKYVLGFLFSRDFTRVVLIKKNRPSWQADKLNGIGGKVEDSDTSSLAAMIREFREACNTMTSEEVMVCDYARAIVDTPAIDAAGIVENLFWLLPMAKEAIQRPNVSFNAVIEFH